MLYGLVPPRCTKLGTCVPSHMEPRSCYLPLAALFCSDICKLSPFYTLYSLLIYQATDFRSYIYGASPRDPRALSLFSFHLSKPYPNSERLLFTENSTPIFEPCVFTISNHTNKKIDDYREIKKALAVSYRQSNHEITLKLYKERMKILSHRDQFDHPGETSTDSEAESKGFLEITRACLKVYH